MSKAKKSVELADVFLKYGDAYIQDHGVSGAQRKAIQAISHCRTAILGGHVSRCDHCGVIEVAYNSCRNRHCPKCQTVKQLRWLDARKSELLPIEYFHVVFTLPHELNGIASYNQTVIYNLLFKAAAITVERLGQDPKRLGGLMGMLALLHTWGQSLTEHIHLHCIIPGGALCEENNGQKKWRASNPGFLFPVRVMSRFFGQTFLTLLEEAKSTLTFKGAIAPLENPLPWAKLIAKLKEQTWNVYAKTPFHGAAGGVEYLARYVSKIAIGNERILSCDDGQVKFKWRDYKDDNTSKIMTLDAHEFIRRYLTHVLPDGFMRIRSFGFLANACKAKNLNVIRSLLTKSVIAPMTVTAVKPKIESAVALILRITGVDVLLCKHCNIGHLEVIESIPKGKQTFNYLDTS